MAKASHSLAPGGLAGSLFTSESVTEGHPDKLCDQVSDAVLDAVLLQDPAGRVACETSATRGLVLVFGEITTTGYVDFAEVVRGVVRDIGYNDASLGFAAEAIAVLSAISEQSPDIAQGVDASLEAREAEAARRSGKAGPILSHDQGAGDQGMMFGYACADTDELMPAPIALAHALTRRLAAVRRDGTLPWLMPDGKSQVSVRYGDDGRPTAVETVVVSAQHDAAVDLPEVRAGILEHVVHAAIPKALMRNEPRLLVNPTGRFVSGGPAADAGLTGRKVIVDTYGGMARHGGGAFSGKDPSKVDRSGAYAARHVAKNIVAAGLAERCEVQVSYAIGVAHPVSLRLETFGTGVLPDATLLELVAAHFDLRPSAIIARLGLRSPIYRQTAAYGHFGRPDLDLPWERTDMALALAAAAGLPGGRQG